MSTLFANFHKITAIFFRISLFITSLVLNLVVLRSDPARFRSFNTVLYSPTQKICSFICTVLNQIRSFFRQTRYKMISLLPFGAAIFSDTCHEGVLVIMRTFSFHKFNYNYFSHGSPNSKVERERKTNLTNKLLSVSSQFKPHGT